MRKKRRSIEQDTVLLPHIIADGVIAEVIRYRCTDAGIGDTWEMADKLADKADHIYRSNSRFAAKLCGVDGREFLYSFMRHWLTAELAHRGIKLPSEFANGLMIGRGIWCRMKL